MPAAAASRRELVSRVGGLKKHRPSDDPLVQDAVRQLAAARAEDYIRALVETAPPLTDSQRARLALLLLAPAGEVA